MATKTQIKNYIKDRVYTNTREAITGDGLQETLCKVVDDLELDPTSGGVEKNYVDTQDQATLSEAKKYTDAKVSGGGEALLTWRYSNVSSESAPLDPDKAPDLWHKDRADDDVWAALKETGGLWNIWRLKPENGTDGRGIGSSVVEYALSDQGNNPPTSGWSKTTPDLVEGKYLWSRTVTTYTDNTTSTVYTVTYIGKDGNDGKNGTSVNIKGSLSSTNDLPTSPKPAEGDGYIIGEDLWVYTGTSLENDKNHNGFTNVGKISVKGDSACLHIAWANSLSPNYDNFTTQKPKGQRFRYMGTYVDYSEDPSTCIDSQNPEDYNWQEVAGEQGESVIVADIDNEIEAIALTYDGKTTASGAFSPVASMWYGTQKLTLDSLTTVVKGTDFSKNVVVVANKDTGIINVSYAEGVELTSFDVNITVKATVNDTQYVKILAFKVKCVKAGAPGEDAVLYKIQPSVTSVHKHSDGSYSVPTITCKKLKVVGKSIEETTDGMLYYKLDAGEKKQYTGGISTVLFTSKIRFELIVDDVLWDAEDIFVIEDGVAPKIDESKTKYYYALTMNHTVPEDSAWSENPVSGLPGQYLWVKTVYTWTDGTITYQISYSRCGSDGKDGTSKPTVISFKGDWKEDGLYTGIETDDSITLDIVYYKSSGSIDGKYYLALATKGFVNETTPQPDTSAGKAYWGAFQGQYANIATGLLFSERIVTDVITAVNAKIENLEVDKIGSKIVDAINLSAKKAVLNDVIVIGSSRNPFTLQTDSFDVNYNDNISTYGGGSLSYAYTIPCDLTQSGRLIRVVNFMWNHTATTGSATISAYNGCCFFENGIRKERIVISREIVSLLGYGDYEKFYGWIVVGRENLMTTKSYGRQLNVLAQGVLDCSSSPRVNASNTFTFDNAALNNTSSTSSLYIKRISSGTFDVHIPEYWDLKSDGYVVMLTTLGRTDSDNVITACVHDKTATSFRMSCQSSQGNWIDDVKVMFMISNVNDWSGISGEVNSSTIHTLPDGIIDINREPMTVVTDWIEQPSEDYKYLFATDGTNSLGLYKISSDYNNDRFTIENDGYKNLNLIHTSSPDNTMYFALSNVSDGSVLEKVSSNFNVSKIESVLSDFRSYKGATSISNPN